MKNSALPVYVKKYNYYKTAELLSDAAMNEENPHLKTFFGHCLKRLDALHPVHFPFQERWIK